MSYRYTYAAKTRFLTSDTGLPVHNLAYSQCLVHFLMDGRHLRNGNVVWGSWQPLRRANSI